MSQAIRKRIVHANCSFYSFLLGPFRLGQHYSTPSPALQSKRTFRFIDHTKKQGLLMEVKKVEWLLIQLQTNAIINFFID